MTPSTTGPARGALVGGAAVAVVVAAALLLRGDVVAATVKSPAALLRIGAIVAAMVALSLFLRRFVENALVRALVMAAPGGVLIWLLVVPYFSDVTVVEALPETSPTTIAAAPAAVPTTASAPTTTSAAAPAGASAPVAVTAPTPASTVAPAGPTRLTAGSLEGIDHRASGSAALYRLDDGSHIVRLEDIDIQSGPDYFVHLVPGVDRRSPSGGVDLGALKGNRGSQNYTIPADVDVESGPFTVLVWCRAFAAPVANATQSPA